MGEETHDKQHWTGANVHLPPPPKNELTNGINIPGFMYVRAACVCMSMRC